jgi:hypothetical protein
MVSQIRQDLYSAEYCPGEEGKESIENVGAFKFIIVTKPVDELLQANDS